MRCVRFKRRITTLGTGLVSILLQLISPATLAAGEESRSSGYRALSLHTAAVQKPREKSVIAPLHSWSPTLARSKASIARPRVGTPVIDGREIRKRR